MSNELYHHGILGMKWGVRRYQNEDGTLTAAGKKRYRADNLSDYYYRKGQKLHDAGKTTSYSKAAKTGIVSGIMALTGAGATAASLALSACGKNTLGYAAAAGVTAVGTTAALAAVAAIGNRELALNEYNKRNGNK